MNSYLGKAPEISLQGKKEIEINWEKKIGGKKEQKQKKKKKKKTHTYKTKT